MNQPFPVNCRQSPQHRNHHIHGLLRADFSASVCDVSLERNSFNVVHDKIGSTVLVEAVGHAGNPRLSHKLGKNSCLFFKSLSPVSKFIQTVR